MKKVIEKLANLFGYQIRKLEKPPYKLEAHDEMQRLCEDIEEPIIFDVGAHFGETVKVFRERIPDSRIFSFEPFPESFETLRLNTADDPKTQIFNYGLTDQIGTQSFHSNSNSATNSLLPTDDMGANIWGKGHLETEKIVEAEFKTIDSVMAELNIQKIDFLKLDVQGAEYLVLKGALEACKNGLIDHVYTEIITLPTYVGQKGFDEALSIFYNSGFDLRNIYNLSLTSDGMLRQVDAIFSRKK